MGFEDIAKMSVSTLNKTVVINSAFLEEIKDSNTALWLQLACLNEACNGHEVRSVVLQNLVGLLNEFRDSLALQLALEESYGYVEVPSSMMSELSHSVEHVRSQHCTLYLTISDLAEQAEELQYRGWTAEHVDELVRQVKLFELQFRDHEQSERHLLEVSRPVLRRRE
jgi:hypothetical protein